MDPQRRQVVSTAALARFAGGDRAAFREIMLTHAHIVRPIVARFWRSPFAQEDALQEVWLRIYDRRDQVDPGRADTFAGWLSTVARRRCIDLVRKEGRSLVIDSAVDPEAVSPGGGILLGAHLGLDPARAAELAEVQLAVDGFVAKLKPAWRRFFQLHIIEGRSYPEIASIEGTSLARCKYMKRVLLRRAERSPSLIRALSFTGSDPDPSPDPSSKGRKGRRQ